MFKKSAVAVLSIILSLLILTSCNLNLMYPNGNSTVTPPKTSTLISSLLDQYSYYDYPMSDEMLSKAVVAAYREVTGDVYAYYYTAEEFEKLQASNSGDNQGIGISVIENAQLKCIEIISVMPDSPALASGVQVGDLIVQIGVGDNAEPVSDLGYDIATKKLQGTRGTVCEFGIVRNGDFENVIEFSIVRDEFVSESVMFTTSSTDSTVGIVKILQFDLTTPKQFCSAMDSLIAADCTNFVFDVRYNPGGDLASIRAVLSYLLHEGDIVIQTASSDGKEEATYCDPISYEDVAYATCNITEQDIGKYRNENYKYAIITNNNTASAAELFTGTLKAYEIATVVGDTTYGKGCMQSIIPLSIYGAQYSGAIKMTTRFYRPYNTENYQGVGIHPSEGYDIPLSEEAAKINVYTLFKAEYQSMDNQLVAAISTFKK